MLLLSKLLRGILVAGCLLGAASDIFGQKAGCSLLNVYDPDGFSEGRKIAVAVFDVGGGAVSSDAGPLERPREILLKSFQKQLKKAKYFSDVSVLAPDAASDADYVLEGNLIGVEGGSRFGRYWVGGFGSMGQMRVSGQILGRQPQEAGQSRPVISDWECNVMNGGMNPFKFGESNSQVTRENASWVASALSFELKHLLRGKEGKTRLDKMESKAESDSDKEPITGKSQPTNRSWREKQEWTPSDYEKEIESFVVRSREERSRGVDALWLTKASYQAEAKFVPLLRQTAILKNQQIKPGMLTDVEAVRPFADQDVIVLVASYTANAKAIPLLWNAKQVRETTYLVRKGGGQHLAPSQFLDDKIASYMVFNERKILKGLSDFRAFHPVILAFPAKMPDGTPFLQSTSDVVEFHTEVDGRPVQLDFNLKDFELRSVDESKMSSMVQ